MHTHLCIDISVNHFETSSRRYIEGSSLSLRGFHAEGALGDAVIQALRHSASPSQREFAGPVGTRTRPTFECRIFSSWRVSVLVSCPRSSIREGHWWSMRWSPRPGSATFAEGSQSRACGCATARKRTETRASSVWVSLARHEVAMFCPAHEARGWAQVYGV